MSDIKCTIDVNQSELDEMRKHEAICVVEYERLDGSRFARVVAMGDKSEMDDVTQTKEFVVMPVGLSVLGKHTLIVSDLVGECEVS